MYSSPGDTGCPYVVLVRLGMTTASITSQTLVGGSDGEICLASGIRPIRRGDVIYGFTYTPSPPPRCTLIFQIHAIEQTRDNIGPCQILARDALSRYLELNISLATPIAYPAIMNFSVLSIHSHVHTTRHIHIQVRVYLSLSLGG